jgi:hypothetical protein
LVSVSRIDRSPVPLQDPFSGSLFGHLIGLHAS